MCTRIELMTNGTRGTALKIVVYFSKSHFVVSCTIGWRTNRTGDDSFPCNRKIAGIMRNCVSLKCNNDKVSSCKRFQRNAIDILHLYTERSISVLRFWIRLGDITVALPQQLQMLSCTRGMDRCPMHRVFKLTVAVVERIERKKWRQLVLFAKFISFNKIIKPDISISYLVSEIFQELEEKDYNFFCWLGVIMGYRSCLQALTRAKVV